jgi:hypothetical protein
MCAATKSWLEIKMENTHPAFNLSADLDDDEVAESVIALNSAETELEIVKVQPSNGKAEPEQVALFDKGEWWTEHWRGMPEFEQKDFMPFKTIYVHFENREDMEKFAKLVGQNIHMTTKSIWYPEAELDEVSKFRWIANPEVPNTKKEELREILDSE